jgi:hypothetical protein
MADRLNDQPQGLPGRETECHLAVSAVLSAQRGIGQAIVFVGPRGMGKTAILAELAREIDGLLTDAVVCRGQFAAPTGSAAPLRDWVGRLAAASLGEPIGSDVRPSPLATIAAQADRRGHSNLRRLVERAAGQAGGAELVEIVVELARLCALSGSRSILFLLDDLHGAAADPGLTEALARAAASTSFAWIATALPSQTLATAFRRAPMRPMDLAGATAVVAQLAALRGRELAPELARAVGACLQGHGALSDSLMREMALSRDLEPGLETLSRQLIECFERSAFALETADRFRALFSSPSERVEGLEALCRFYAESEDPLGSTVLESRSPILVERTAALRALGFLDWQNDDLAPTPLWAFQQLASLWRDQSSGRVDPSGGRFWRGAEVLRRVRAAAPAGETCLDANGVAACLSALSGGEIESRHFVVLPEAWAPNGRLVFPRAVVAEPLNATPALAGVVESSPRWLAVAGMLGLASLEDNPADPGEMVFWVMAAFSPPVLVTDEDVRQVRRLAESLAAESAGVPLSGVWIVGGAFQPMAERAAKVSQVALSTWSAWRELNSLPDPTPEQFEIETPALVGDSDKGFFIDLTAEDSQGEAPAAEAAEALAESGGFPQDQCSEIHDAVSRGCRTALSRVSGRRANARVRARISDQSITISVEHETPRWRSATAGNGDANARPDDWDLGPLRSRMDEVFTEQLPWGCRLILRKRLDLFSQLS